MTHMDPFISTTLHPFSRSNPLHFIGAIVAGLTIFPIRIILSILNILFVVINSYLIQCLRAYVNVGILDYILRLQMRWQLVLFGFWWIRVNGTPSGKRDAPIIVSNHLTLVDAAFLIFHTGACGLSAIENSRRAVISTLANAINTIWVDRAAGGSNTVDNLRRIAEDPHGRQILIFPEGTCGNGTAINSFKSGAFVPMVPVQPVTLRYNFNHFDPSWCNIGPNLNQLILYMMLSWYNTLEVTYHPVQTLLATEKSNPKAYAVRVQNVMAQALGVPISCYSFDDIRLANKCRALGLDPKIGLIELDQIRLDHPTLTYQDAVTALEHFAKETPVALTRTTFETYLRQSIVP